MTQYTPSQLKALKHAAKMAYLRISKAVEHDDDLGKADMVGMGEYVSRVQGALLDLGAHIDSLLAQEAIVKQFRVTELMLEVLDDYIVRQPWTEWNDDEGRRALKIHFPQLTADQRNIVIRKWRKQMGHSTT